MHPANPPQPPAECPRCHSLDTKFCYFNNYNLSQPRHFCKSCRRYWTFGGTLRDVPVGGSTRRPGVAGSPLPPTKRRRRDPNGGKLAVRREEEAVVLKPEEVVVGDVRGSFGQVLAEPLDFGEVFLKGGGCFGLDLGLAGVEEEMGFGVRVGRAMTWPFEGEEVVGIGAREEAWKGGEVGGDGGGFGSKEGKRVR